MDNTLLVLYSFVIGGDCDAFENAYREYLPQQQQFPGHMGETLVRAENETSSYTIVSRWQTTAFYRWLQSSEHDSMVEMLNRFQRERSSVKRYVVVSSHGVEML